MNNVIIRISCKIKIMRNKSDTQYKFIQYRTFNQSKTIRFFRKLFASISLPFLYPLIFLSNRSDLAFVSISEFLSLIPFAMGIIIREIFYQRTLNSVGENVSIGFGTVFYYRDVSIGDNVMICIHCTIYHCNIGNDVLIGDGCRILNGSRQHRYDSIDLPMTMQGGWIKKISIGNDVWVGTNAVVMNDIKDGAVIGAGAVVNRKVSKYSICAGNPAKIIGSREIG